MNKKLQRAKTKFDKAAKHTGDAGYTNNLMAEGLSLLTSALMEMCPGTARKSPIKTGRSNA
jgi:hypothetical protein